jgi:hypothetical protein
LRGPETALSFHPDTRTSKQDYRAVQKETKKRYRSIPRSSSFWTASFFILEIFDCGSSKITLFIHPARVMNVDYGFATMCKGWMGDLGVTDPIFFRTFTQSTMKKEGLPKVL